MSEPAIVYVGGSPSVVQFDASESVVTDIGASHVIHTDRHGLVSVESDHAHVIHITTAETVFVVRDEHSILVADPLAPTVIAAGNQGPPGVQGEQGPPGADGAGNIEVSFSWGDVSPYLLGTIDGLVVAASVVIETAFNGTAPTLTIGTLASPSLLMGADQNDPAEEARYEANPGARLNDEAVYLFINSGLGASAGAGTAYIEIAG